MHFLVIDLLYSLDQSARPQASQLPGELRVTPATPQAPAGTYQESLPVTSVTAEEMSVKQTTGPVSHFTTSQAPASTNQEGRPATQHSVTGEMPVLKPVRRASQSTATQPATGICDNPLPSTSSAGASSQYIDYDFDQQSDSTLLLLSILLVMRENCLARKLA